MEDRILAWRIKERNYTTQAKNMNNFLNTAKEHAGNVGPNLRSTGIDEREETQVNGTDQIFRKTREQTFPN